MAASSGALSFLETAVIPPPASSHVSATGRGNLGELDELARDAGSRGFVLVHGTESVLDAVVRHVERRARALGRPLVRIDGLPTDDPWRELAARLLPRSPVDAAAAARAILERAGAAVLVVRGSAPTHFGRALSAELARCLAEGSSRALLLSLCCEETLTLGPASLGSPSSEPAEPAPPAISQVLPDEAGSTASTSEAPRVVVVESEVWGEDLQLWWDAVARDPGHGVGSGVDRLDSLEAWWTAARSTPLGHRAAPPPLGPEAARILGRLVLSQRSWPVAQVGRLGPTGALQELVRSGVMELDPGGRLVAGRTPAPPVETDTEDRLAVAAALETLPDPWASARAGELYAAAGAFEKAEAAAMRAITAAPDAASRADLWQRWEEALGTLPPAEAHPRLLRGVDLALRSSELERAASLANAALQAQPGAFQTSLALGRVSIARGDVSTATFWLSRARGAAEGPGAAMIEVELAEVCHMGGDMEGAARHAELTLAAPGADAEARLHARNVMGKVLLNQKAWARAEAHFAADACEATLAGDHMARMRACLNRGVALISAGRFDDARPMLRAVVDEGEARGEPRAVAHALNNLAALAALKRDYPEALRLSERAFETHRQLGDKVALAVLITNLADLKLQLGMVDEAEQTLAFGRQAVSPGMPGSRISHFAVTAALVHLARGRTDRAAAEIRTALEHARASAHGSHRGECWRVAARIALEDGDLSTAGSAIAEARRAAESPREHAWVALLEASRARAAGEPFAGAAEQARSLARAADDPELGRDAHVLLHHAAALAGDAHAARGHLDTAVALRDQLAEPLPADARLRFLSRRDLAELARLVSANEGALARAVDDEVLSRPFGTLPPPKPSVDGLGSGASPASLRRPITAKSALERMVGSTPSMRALASAISKVGQTDATLLVHGESGTGKELVAEAIHEASPRRAGPIVKVNCSALVETLLLSELFGHEKGSFTGAAARRRGRFELAEGGTLFLDEIGDISPRTQVALLRVLQDKTYERVGGVTPLRANVRIVCATHRDLAAMVARGEFREDLYYRLRGVVLEVPALRHRLADLPHLAEAILEVVASERGTKVKRLSASALDGLCRHPWPGNVRELENALRAAALFAETDVIDLSDLATNVVNLRALAAVEIDASALSGGCQEAPTSGAFEMGFSGAVAVSADGTDGASNDDAMPLPSKIAPLVMSEAPGNATEVAYAAIRAGISLSELKRDIERDCIARALAETGGNITRAASLLGMKRPRLSQLVKQYGFGAQQGAGSDVDADAEDGE